MIALTARDALSDGVVCVTCESRPSLADLTKRRGALYAVYDEPQSDSLPAAKFLGLVSVRRAALYPQRIFADLLPACLPDAVRIDTPLETIRQQLDDDRVEAIPVVNAGHAFVGAVTRESLFAALLEQERSLFDRLRQTIDLQQQQRRLIAYELHDGLVQYATAAHMHLQALAVMQGELRDDAREQLEHAMRLMQEGVNEARRLITGLNPPALDEAGLIVALELLVQQARRPGAPEIELVCYEQTVRLPTAVEVAIYRIVQEGLNNAVRHSQSDRVRIGLSCTAGQICVEIRDWGRGFDAAKTVSGHHGLEGIRERARMLGGQVSIESAPGQGTTIRVELPER